LSLRPGREAARVTIREYAPLAQAHTTVVVPRIELKALHLLP
jgi:hypothetical protein